MAKRHNPGTGVCSACKKNYQKTGYAQQYCSIDCKPKQPRQEYDAEKYQIRRKKMKEDGRLRVWIEKEYSCVQCSCKFLSKSANAKYCSRVCSRKNKRKYDKWKSVLDKYGITREQYEEIERSQNGVCAICKRKRKLCVDHDHNTLKVRGLLCRPCNRILGMMNDSPEYLRTATDYLERNENGKRTKLV